MFSEQTAPIGTYDIPIDSEFHAYGQSYGAQKWSPDIDRVFSSV